jgi:TonB family protein
MIAAACPVSAVQMVKAAPVAYPNSATLSDDLVVLIDVTVGADGKVKSVRVTHTSGQTDADKAALAAARASQYRPAARNCTPIAGHYAFTTTFVAPVTPSSGLPPAP